MKINQYLLIVFVISVGLFQNCGAGLQTLFRSSDNDETSPQPDFRPKPLYECAGSTYCTTKSPQYPQKYIDKYLKNHRFIRLNDATSLDLQGRNLIEDPSERSVCNAVTEVKHFYQVKNKYNEWYYAIQTDDYTQGLEVEICSFPGDNSSCESVVKSDLVKAFCMQQFTTHIVLALGHDGNTTTVATKFPTCCVCAYID